MDKALSQLEASMELDMTSLIRTMRTMLANLKEEQQAIMLKNQEGMRTLLNVRHEILEEMRFHRGNMLSKINELRHFSGIENKAGETCEEELTLLIQGCGLDNLIVLSLKDQILALAEAIDRQNSRNQLLINCGKNLLLKPCPWFKPTPKVVIQTLESQECR